ncbi:hypothetical protein EGJ15_20035, partial [Pseudomonas sp. p99-361]
ACTKAFARKSHRNNWPETNVGASAARDCAARAALDLTGAEDAPATLARNHRISHRYCTTFRAGAFPVGAGLPAIGPSLLKVNPASLATRYACYMAPLQKDCCPCPRFCPCSCRFFCSCCC